MRHLPALGLSALLLAACTPPAVEAPVTAPPLARDIRLSPPQPDAGQCWHQEVSPALYETVTLQRLTAEGVTSETQQRQLRDRTTIWFRIPCPPEVGPADLYIASLQRALKARGLYQGAITGQLSPETREAVRRYQLPLGLNSQVLSRSAARSLGILAFY